MISPTNSGVPKMFLNSFPALIWWAIPKSISLILGLGTFLSSSMMFSGWEIKKKSDINKQDRENEHFILLIQRTQKTKTLLVTHDWPWGQSEQCVWSADSERHLESVSETAWPPPPSVTPSQRGSRTTPLRTPVPGSGSRQSCFQRCRARWWCCCAGSLSGCSLHAQSPRGSPPVGWRRAVAFWWTWLRIPRPCSSPCTYGQLQTVHFRGRKQRTHKFNVSHAVEICTWVKSDSITWVRAFLYWSSQILGSVSSKHHSVWFDAGEREAFQRTECSHIYNPHTFWPKLPTTTHTLSHTELLQRLHTTAKQERHLQKQQRQMFAALLQGESSPYSESWVRESWSHQSKRSMNKKFLSCSWHI